MSSPPSNVALTTATADELAAQNVIASCRLHGLDPFQYLEEILHVLPYWPRDRYLELSPKYWRATRGRLRADDLATPISAFDVPPPQGELAAMSASAGPSP